jgi:hypothetical protein
MEHRSVGGSVIFPAKITTGVLCVGAGSAANESGQEKRRRRGKAGGA